ncbi:polysaccharide biosynthesis/export family protein [Spirosoma rhododendri]|nr:polysaccharide biosynthesis/export family protein [Spirosoma rhododendri]
MLSRVWLVLGTIGLLTGCASTKDLSYFQKSAGSPDQVATLSRYTPTVQAGDILSIQISSLNPEASTFFNPYTSFAVADRASQPVTPTTTSPLQPVSGYMVDPDGAVELPVIGKLSVKGLTMAQVRERVREPLREYLKEPTVNVRNLTFRVSVMGEVSRPSLFTVPNEQMTLLEALSLAGDVTIYGRRTDVLVIREENGQRKFGHVDLTRRDLFASPYYYLHPNDVVYVEPSKVRAATADRTMQLAPIAISALSFVAILVSRF